MSEETVETPVEQVEVPKTDTPPQQAQTQPPAPQEDWKKRYDGTIQTLEKLTLKNRELEEKLAQMSSEKEQLMSQLSIKDTEKSVAVGERDKILEQTLKDKEGIERELHELRAMKAKLDLVKKHDAGQVIPILDSIPYSEDPEVMEKIFTDFVSWGDNLAKNRQDQILAGWTPPVAAGSEKPAGGPNSAAEWMKKIQSLPEGQEKQQAWDDYFKWGSQSQ